MGNDPPVNAIPTLSYFDERSSDPFRLFVRLLLLAGAVSAFATLISTAISSSTEIAGALLFGNAGMPEYWLAVALAVQILVTATVAIFYLILLGSGVGSLTIVCGETALIVLRGLTAALLVLKYDRMGNNFPSHWMLA